jgi:cytochrome c oxidase subunit 2
MDNTFRLVPQRASEMAGHVDALFLFLVALTAFFTLLIAGMILVFVVKYRRRDPRDVGKDIGSHRWLEWTWIIIPSLLALVIFFWGAALYVRMSRPPANALEIQVIGKQWMWKIQHPSGRKEIDELHVPLGRPVKLVMTSQDVIHSFFIPEFRVKQDVLPGRYSTEWFTPTALGEYHLFCAEYCGTSHAGMIGRVVVMEPGDYEKWVANAALDDRPEAAGARLFTQYGCMSCHGQTAPSLAGIYNRPQLMQDGDTVTADDNYLRESILNSRAKIVKGYPPIMPSYQGQLSEEQILQLLAYIKSLHAAATPPATTLPQNGGAP